MTDPAPLDLLVLGSGVAGLSAAVRAAETHGLRVGVLTKGELDQTTTRWAQGGVAAVLGGDPDSTDLHLADTLAAGAGLCDVDAVRALVDEGPARVNELIALGAIFDRDPDGALQLAREGGHSHPRVVHAGGAATGLEVERALVTAVRRTAAALYERWFACDLLVEHGRCVGVVAIPPPGERPDDQPGAGAAAGRLVEIRARHVLVATGGAGQLFAVTTNPAEATGDGIAMALRAGAAVADLEFVQFHPTALHHPSRPRPLLSEALRGHGALLRDAKGERFVDELLPRDRVSRVIQARLAEQEVDHVWLDATGLEDFVQRFPTIAAALAEVGLDPARDWLPVAPAAHYTCGGIVADLDGASSLPGLWVAGEAACNGVHGANRLASNSLLDGMVFGPRVVEAVERGKDGPDPTGAMRAVPSVAGHDTTSVAPGGVASAPPPHAADRGVTRQTAAAPEPPDAPAIPGVVLRLPTSGRPGPSAAPPGHGRAADTEASPVTSADPEGDVAGRLAGLRSRLQRAMTAHAGVLRSATSLDEASAAVEATMATLAELAATTSGEPAGERPPASAGGRGVPNPGKRHPHSGSGPHGAGSAPAVARAELANLATVGRVVGAAALARKETRGAHSREDFPDRSASLRVRFVTGG